MHIRKYSFPLTKSRLNHRHGFVSCCLHSVLGERLFHIPDPYFRKFKFQAALSPQLVQMERSEATLIGLRPLPSAISQLSGGRRGRSACSAESLERTILFTPQPNHRSSGVQAPGAPRAFCLFLMSQLKCCVKCIQRLFPPIFKMLILTK